ncbi:MFS transporter [Streptomyces sp. NPDC055775]
MTGASTAVLAAPTAREVTAAARATYAVFAGSGLAGSTWSSRLPEVRRQLNLDSASLGLLRLTATGVALFALRPSTGLAFAGSLLRGMGAALGFPISMSAGADEPARAAGRVSVITSIGYCGFVGGPPLIGFLGNQTTVGHALLVITVLMALSAVIAGTTRRSPDNRTQSGSDTQARTAAL